jgi:hypothetical protein
VRILAWLDESDRRTFQRAAKKREERRLRWGKKSLAFHLIATQVPLLLVAAAGLWFTVTNDRTDRHVAAALEHDGVDVEGTAVHFRFRLQGWDLLFGDQAQVVFKTEDGRSASTWVPTGKLPQKGAVSLSYVRSDPSVARLVADPTPRVGRFWILLGLYAACLLLTVSPTIICWHLYPARD